MQVFAWLIKGRCLGTWGHRERRREKYATLRVPTAGKTASTEAIRRETSYYCLSGAIVEKLEAFKICLPECVYGMLFPSGF